MLLMSDRSIEGELARTAARKGLFLTEAEETEEEEEEEEDMEEVAEKGEEEEEEEKDGAVEPKGLLALF
eukprot:MONOS_8396.1-p1 / transcript=MONOS_8396.1 / gene=MONOS_8396 / organism=Monocercomonoides_exilis_PA203 / gene_product=unspecified product / transcript_product=unspecified product / location=Mono_scaffold00315:39199-40074(-) / protein_length=69 / sequence_SO=supercontig / SO=protein_coding / is_pseudo=false